MGSYLLRRLLLLPLTLFAILLVNFVIINLAPNDPSTVSQISPDGSREANKQGELGREDQYLLFREHYGLTLPILFNLWPSISLDRIENSLQALATRHWPDDPKREMRVKEYNDLRMRFGDKARYLMPRLIEIAEEEEAPQDVREMAVRYFVRGGLRQGYVGPNLSAKQKAYNRKIAGDNQFLREQRWLPEDDILVRAEKISELRGWYERNRLEYQLQPNFLNRARIFFLETRFTRYFSRVLTLDFGTLRNDANRTVVGEVAKRFKYSLTLAVVPMCITFILCQFFGFLMALKQNRWPDFSLNLLFLVLYAIPVFVVAPFLIEKVALHHTVPFLDAAIPISGFHSPDQEFVRMTSLERVGDVMLHIFLPLIAVMYGSLAMQARLSRTAVLEVLRQDYVRTARAKGVAPFTILWKHVGRNAAITIVTALAASLGVILGGSLIIETIFGIDGFGRFFYEAILNRDYNVIMFSALAGAFLALVGYLLADLAYMFLDPRVTLDR